MQVTFSPLDPESLPRALEFQAELYSHEGLPVHDRGRELAMAELMAHAQYGGAWLIGAAGEAAGYVVLTACYSLEFHGAFGLLDELYIDEARRGQGLGQAALAFVDAECRRRGWKAVRLEVGHTNLRALALYRKAGYYVEDRHLMTKWL